MSNAIIPADGMQPISKMDTVTEELINLIPGDPQAPRSVRMAAGQIALSHGLNPFNGEVYVYSTGSTKVNNQWVKQWTADVGVKGFRRSARKQGDYDISFRWMDAAEVKAHIGKDYTDGDVGMVCEGYRLDRVQKLRSLGLEVRPTLAYGFWRQKANYNNSQKKWYPDNIPATWTPVMVAQKRAEKNWLKQNFDMGFPNDYVVEDKPTSNGFIVDEDTQRLIEAYGTDGLSLEDEQREVAIKLLKQTEAGAAEWRELDDEEKEERFDSAVNLLRGNGKKRLGEPIIIEDEPKKDSYTPQEVLDIMRAENGSLLVKQDTEPADPLEAQDEQEQPASNGKPMPDDELVIKEAPQSEFFKVATELIPRYSHPKATTGCAKKLGYTVVPGKSYERVEMYKAIRDYAAQRDADDAAKADAKPVDADELRDLAAQNPDSVHAEEKG